MAVLGCSKCEAVLPALVMHKHVAREIEALRAAGEDLPQRAWSMWPTGY